MILVTGGSFQGKREFVEKVFVERGHGGAGGWTDGSAASWEEFMEGRRCCHFHLFVRRVLEGGVGPGGPRGRIRQPGQGGYFPGREDVRRLVETLAGDLLAGPQDRILVTDEIGCGIVPADAFERMYREETGRLCCLAAREAQQVWRVCCGVGMRIK